jgi:hypothetical protein
MDIAVNFDKNLEIYYWNDDNTDLFLWYWVRHFNKCRANEKQEGVSEGRK